MKEIISELYNTYRDKRKFVTMSAFLMIFMFVICESASRKMGKSYGDAFCEMSSYYYFYTMLWFAGFIFSGYKVDAVCHQANDLRTLCLMVRKRYGALVLQTIALSAFTMIIMRTYGYRLNLMLLSVTLNLFVLNVANLPIIIMRQSAALGLLRSVFSSHEKYGSVIPVCVFLLSCFLCFNIKWASGLLFLMCCGMAVFGVVLYVVVERVLMRWVSKQIESSYD